MKPPWNVRIFMANKNMDGEVHQIEPPVNTSLTVALL